MPLQNLTEEVLWNFMHKQHEYVSFKKKNEISPAASKRYFMSVPQNNYWLDHLPEVENLTEKACWKNAKLNKKKMASMQNDVPEGELTWECSKALFLGQKLAGLFELH